MIFASGTAAERFRRLVPRWPVEPKVAVIGPATAWRGAKEGWKVVVVSPTPDPSDVLCNMLKKSQAR